MLKTEALTPMQRGRLNAALDSSTGSTARQIAPLPYAGAGGRQCN